MEIVTKFCNIYNRTRTRINIHDRDISEVNIQNHEKKNATAETRERPAFHVINVESEHGRISVFLDPTQAEKIYNELSERFAEKVEV